MADQTAFPQIPSTVWWGMRNLLKKSPNAKFDADMIGASLGVQPAASKQYIAELKRIGILDDEGKATPAALKWRQDDQYSAAVSEIASGAYPESLLTIAPPGDADRQTVVNWFIGQNLGEGSAKNKAATYLLVTSSEPNEASSKNSVATKTDKSTKTSTGKSASSKASPSKTKSSKSQRSPSSGSTIDGVMPLNVNVQIHISADASNDQIETIFSSMRKYLRDD